MDKLSEHSPALTFFSASLSDPQPARRLIVLVPADTDYAAAVRKIQEVANAFKGRRQLVTLSAMVGDGSVSVESKIGFGRNWLDVVKPNFREGDAIACFAERHSAFAWKPLSEILESNLHAPVYVIPGMNVQNRWPPRWLSNVVVWVGSLGIIVGSALLQIRIASLPSDWAQTTLFLMSIVAEAWLIWVWNDLFG